MYHIIEFSSFATLENKYVDSALDKIKQVDGFKNLPELDKLVLFSNADDTKGLKRISLVELFKQNGGKFEPLTIKVRIKDKEHQPINHLYSKEEAGKEGWIRSAYIFSDNVGKPYVTVRFLEFQPDSKSFGGGQFKELPIMIHNLYPIGYGDVEQEFINYHNRVEQDRKKFRKGWDDSE